MNIPPMAWVVLALGMLWLILRWWQGKQAQQRAEAREARMAELYAERERLLQRDEPPSSLGAVVSEPKEEAAPPKERVCFGCKTVNPGDATTCSGCGLEL
jgi:hypothetical protein